MTNYKAINRSFSEHKIVILPTETVYGMAILYDDSLAYEKLIKLKKRDFSKPVAMMVPPNYNFEDYFYLNDAAKIIIKKFLPGPLTVLLKSKANLPYQVHLGTNIVGIRMPKDKRLIQILKRINKPMQVTSCNISNTLPCTSYKEAVSLFGSSDDIGIIIKGKTKSNIPTTVVDITCNDIKILREGEIKTHQIMEALK